MFQKHYWRQEPMTANADKAMLAGFVIESSASSSIETLGQTGFTPAHLKGSLLDLWLEQEPETDGVNRFEACDESDCGY
jgi:hypothetical protein